MLFIHVRVPYTSILFDQSQMKDSYDAIQRVLKSEPNRSANLGGYAKG